MIFAGFRRTRRLFHENTDRGPSGPRIRHSHRARPAGPGGRAYPRRLPPGRADLRGNGHQRGPAVPGSTGAQPCRRRLPDRRLRHPGGGKEQVPRPAGGAVGAHDGLRPHPHRRGGRPRRRRGGGLGGLCRRHRPPGGGLRPDPHHSAGTGGLLRGRQGGRGPEGGEKPRRGLLPAEIGAHGPRRAGHPARRHLCRRHGGGHQVRLHPGPGLFRLPRRPPLPAGGHGGH